MFQLLLVAFAKMSPYGYFRRIASVATYKSALQMLRKLFQHSNSIYIFFFKLSINLIRYATNATIFCFFPQFLSLIHQNANRLFHNDYSVNQLRDYCWKILQMAQSVRRLVQSLRSWDETCLGYILSLHPVFHKFCQEIILLHFRLRLKLPIKGLCEKSTQFRSQLFKNNTFAFTSIFINFMIVYQSNHPNGFRFQLKNSPTRLFVHLIVFLHELYFIDSRIRLVHKICAIKRISCASIYQIELFVMERKEMTLIYYHVPQDRDDPEVPNMFAIPISKQNLKLAHIYQYFPLKGKYTFRFKFAHQGFIVWLDIADPTAKLPLFKDKVCIKATRLSWNQSKGTEQSFQSTKVNSQVKKQELNLFDHHEQKSNSAASEKKQGQKGQNLLGGIAQMPVFTQPNLNDGLNFFEVPSSSASKKGDVHLMGSFDKHGDLI